MYFFYIYWKHYIIVNVIWSLGSSVNDFDYSFFFLTAILFFYISINPDLKDIVNVVIFL